MTGQGDVGQYWNDYTLKSLISLIYVPPYPINSIWYYSFITKLNNYILVMIYNNILI